MKRIAWIAFLLAALAAASPGRAGPSLIERVQEKYLATGSIRASFVQKTVSKAVMAVSTAEGEVYIKKPGKMRWDYREPEVQSFVSNRGAAWLVAPVEKRVYLYETEDVMPSRVALGFLAGEERLDKHFDISVIEEKEETFTLELEPREEMANVSSIELRVKRRGLVIRSVTTVDTLGNRNILTFSQVEENVDIPDARFELKVPEGFRVERQNIP